MDIHRTYIDIQYIQYITIYSEYTQWSEDTRRMCHSFPMDAADPDRQGVPEDWKKCSRKLPWNIQKKTMKITPTCNILSIKNDIE